MDLGTCIRIGLFAICSLFGVLPQIGWAQNITVDGRFSPAHTLMAAGGNYSIGANLGKQVGTNLFHSFGKFGLTASESASFISVGSTGPISNVIGRVTGGTMSSIDGKIQSIIPMANLYLINPSGIVFGQHATIDVKGSFHASTADYIKMSNGARFQATNPDGSTLSSAPPAAFGFLNATPGKIAVNGSTLEVLSGKTLGLVGGPVSINRGQLLAPAGTIRVTSVAGTGEVPAATRTGSKATVTGHGPIDIKNASSLDVSGNSSGSVFIRAGTLNVDGSAVYGDNYDSAAGGRLVLRADGGITLSGRTLVHSGARGRGNGGAISIEAGSVSISNAAIEALTYNEGNGGNISIKVADALSIAGETSGILTEAQASSTGTPGNIRVRAGSLSVLDNGSILSRTFGARNSGSISINAGVLDLQTSGRIESRTHSMANSGDVTVNAATANISGISEINAETFGSGNAGTVSVSISGNLTIVGPAADNPFNSDVIEYTGIGTVANGSTGNAGSVTVNAGSLSISGLLGQISSSTLTSGAGGDVSVDVVGRVSIAGPHGHFPTGIVAGAFPNIAAERSTGRAGSVAVTAGSLSIVDGGEISSTTVGPGAAGNVSVNIAGPLSIAGPRAISPTGILAVAFPGSAGNAGSVAVNAGSLSIVDGGEISSITFGTGAGGSVMVRTSGPLLLASGAQIAASATGLQSGPGGPVTVDAGSLTVQGGAQIASSTAGPGKGGPVQVTAQGPLRVSDPGSGILASTTSSGNAGSVTVNAPQITVTRGAEITSTTAGAGVGGSVSVTTPGALVLDGMGVGGTRIAASADQGSLGEAGDVTVGAGNLTVQGGAQIASSTAGPGKGGTVQVTAHGPLSLSDPSSGIVALATNTASGTAGSVMVDAPQISVTSGAQIASTTAGTGAGGSVAVTTPGALVLDGMGITPTQIAASAIGTASGPGGRVTIAANTLIVGSGAQIASSTAGPGKGGDVTIMVVSDLVLPDPGPQITALSTGSGDAGSITLSAARLLMNNDASISTEAVGERSAASGGNITLHLRDLLYLTSSQISTSVKGETGNGGNITIDPELAILNHSSIIAQAVEGHGGNITITADQFIPSTDSIVSATSEKGISGSVVINGPRVDVNGALVVLSSELRGRAEVLREACAARGGRPISSFVEAGRGGLPQDPEATLPALYIAGRDVNPNASATSGTARVSGALQTTVHLTMRCG